MSSSLKKLPLSLQKSLQRWYLFSACAVTITLCALATLHILTHNSPPTSTTDTILETPLSEQHLSADFFEHCTAKQTAVLKLLAQIIAALPAQLMTTRIVVAPHDAFIIEGKTPHQTNIGVLLQHLRQSGFESATLTACTLSECKEQTTFVIKAGNFTQEK